MPISRRSLLGSAALAAVVPSVAARAASTPVIKIGVINDMSGVYSAETGQGDLACAQEAVAEFTAANKGFAVEVVSADNQNNPEIASGIVRQWFGPGGVDAIIGGGNSATALATNTLARQTDKVFVSTDAAARRLTGKECGPNTLHWSFDNRMLARSTGGTLAKTGGRTWYFITADYVFGHSLREATSKFVVAAGGKVLGSVTYPFPTTTDFSSYLVRAKASGAEVIGLCNAGVDTQNCIKQAREFSIASGDTRLAALLLIITDVHSLGLPAAQGLVLTESFYWNLNDRARAFTKRVLPRMPNQERPNMMQAGCYSGVLHYLKAVKEIGPEAARKSGRAAVAAMKAIPVDDDAFGKTTIRADGRHMVPAYLFQVKAPAESKEPWDYYKLLATTPAEEAAVPVAETGCYLDKA